MKKLLVIIGILGLFVFATPPTPILDTTNISSTTFVIDTTKSVLVWKAMIHTGEVPFVEGEIEYLNGLSEMRVILDMKNLSNTDVKNELLKGTLENVLKSPDFFNVEKFPKASFELHASTNETDNSNLSGDFTLFDNWSQCVNFDAQIEIKGDSLYLTTNSIALDRTDWGIYYLSKNNPFPKEEEESMEVPDTIFVKAHLVAYKK